MKRPLALVLLGAAAALLVVTGCDFLPFNDFEPTGTLFYLNAGIEAASITGDPRLSDYGPFTLAFNARASGATDVRDTLPAGLLFRSARNSTQHMLLLKDHPITASPGVTANALGSFCCNQRRVSPDRGDTFELGPITDDPGLQQLVTLVRGKDISDGGDMWMVQRAVYLVTDSTGLTQAYIDSINALPPDTGRFLCRAPMIAGRGGQGGRQ
jgi:hypothetical protein